MALISLDDRVKLFKEEVEKLERRFKLQIVPILKSTPSSINAELTLLDTDPPKKAPPLVNN